MKRILFVILASILTFAGPLGAADVKKIDKDELKQKLGSAELVVLDVRTGRDWEETEFKIRGAVRVDPSDVESWAGKFPPDKTYVLYCA